MKIHWPRRHHYPPDEQSRLFLTQPVARWWFPRPQDHSSTAVIFRKPASQVKWNPGTWAVVEISALRTTARNRLQCWESKQAATAKPHHQQVNPTRRHNKPIAPHGQVAGVGAQKRNSLRSSKANPRFMDLVPGSHLLNSWDREHI